MLHDTDLIATIAIGFSVAFFAGLLALRLRLPPIVGYLVAGIAIGPYTPGFSADVELAPQLAEIGVILLMFGVGVHFSLKDLLAVRRVAIPGAIAQIAVATGLGIGLASLWGWGLGAGIVLGFSLSVASTVVLLRALMQHGQFESMQGRVAVGWLILEDLFTVLALVMLPVLAGPLGGTASSDANVFVALGTTLAKVAFLVAVMLFVGGRVVPKLLVYVARSGSREMFTLAVLAVALGIAFTSAELFGVSLALGAFLAGLVISEPDVSHQATSDSLPLQDAFAVLFFVSVGMLFEPSVLIDYPQRVLAVVAIVMIGKTVAAGLIVLALGFPLRIALTIAAALSQIGEFSFILAEMGGRLDLLPDEGHTLILAGAIFSITLNPFMFMAIDPVERWIHQRPRLAELLERRSTRLATLGDTDDGPQLRGHVVLCGYGQVGQVIEQVLSLHGLKHVIIDQSRRRVEALRERGSAALYGDAANTALLDHACISTARSLIIAVPDAPATRHIIDHARSVNPDIHIVVRTHSEEEREYLQGVGIEDAILGELELAIEMARVTLEDFNAYTLESAAVLQSVRESAEPLNGRFVPE